LDRYFQEFPLRYTHGHDRQADEEDNGGCIAEAKDEKGDDGFEAEDEAAKEEGDDGCGDESGLAGKSLFLIGDRLQLPPVLKHVGPSARLTTWSRF
jgi:hypothetical protein